MTLEVLQEMTGCTMTELLESCVRIGKKTVAKARGLNYQDLLFNITTKRAELKARRWNQIESEDVTMIDELELEERIALAKTKWANGEDE